MSDPRPEKVEALARAACNGMSRAAGTATANEGISAALTVALGVVRAAVDAGGDVSAIRNGIHRLLMECPTGPSQ